MFRDWCRVTHDESLLFDQGTHELRTEIGMAIEKVKVAWLDPARRGSSIIKLPFHLG